MALDPIQPIGAEVDGVRISRPGQVARVERRFTGAQDDGSRQGHHHHHHHEDAHRGLTWGAPHLDPAAEAGAYDDHGRTGTTAAEAVPHLHLDVSA